MSSRSTALVLYHPAVRRLTSLNRRCTILGSALERIWMEALEARTMLSGGALDTTFGKQGVASAFGSASTASAYAVAVLPNNNIVAAGYVTQSDGTAPPALAMFNPNGSLDTAFGNGGTVITPLNGDDGTIETILPMSNGKLLVAGEDDTLNEFMLARYNANGSLDSSFGQGVVVTPNSNDASGDGWIDGLALQSDGKIIALGEANSEMTVARYNSDGSLDTSFGDNGIFMVQGNSADQDEYALAATVQPDGSITVYGGGTGDSTTFWGANYVLQLTASGQQTSLQEYDQPQNNTANGDPLAATGPDGKVVLGSGYLSRYNTDGSPDDTFGSDGTFGPLAQNDSAAAVGVRSDGAVFVVGENFSLERYNPDGTVDTRFGDQGLATLPADVTNNLGDASAIAFQSDGSIIVADDDFDVIRYIPGTDATPPQPTTPSTLQPPPVVEPTPPTTNPGGPVVDPINPGGPVSFNPGGPNLPVTTAPVSVPQPIATFDASAQIPNGQVTAAAVQPNGQIIAAGTSNPTTDGSQPDEIALVRFNPDGTLDTSFGNVGAVITSIGPDDVVVQSVTVMPDGQILVAGNDDEQGTFLLAMYNADGSLDASFGTGGIVNAVPPASSGGYNTLDGVTVTPDGSIYVFGDDGTQSIVAHFNADGSPDLSFGNAGVASMLADALDSSEAPTSLTLNSDGSLTLNVSGSDQNQNAVAYAIQLSATGQQLSVTPASVPPSPAYTPLTTLSDGSTLTASDAGFGLLQYAAGVTPFPAFYAGTGGGVITTLAGSAPTVTFRLASAGTTALDGSASHGSATASDLNQYVSLDSASTGQTAASSDGLNTFLSSSNPLASFSQSTHKPDDWMDSGAAADS